MTFPALPYEVDEHLVTGMQALYQATDRFRQIPLDRLDPAQQMTVREAVGRIDAIKDALFVLRHGRERSDDVPPEDLLGQTSAIRRLRPVTKRIYELLADGEWHDYGHVVREARKEVLPGEAHRHMEAKRTETRADETPPEERARPRDDAWLVERGSRAITVSTISGLDRIEMDPPRAVRADQRRIRLRPPNLTRERRLQLSEVQQPTSEPVPDPAPDTPDRAEVTS